MVTSSPWSVRLTSSGTGVVNFALYSEMRIRLMHVMIGRMIAEGQARVGA